MQKWQTIMRIRNIKEENNNNLIICLIIDKLINYKLNKLLINKMIKIANDKLRCTSKNFLLYITHNINVYTYIFFSHSEHKIYWRQIKKGESMKSLQDLQI